MFRVRSTFDRAIANERKDKLRLAKVSLSKLRKTPENLTIPGSAPALQRPGRSTFTERIGAEDRVDPPRHILSSRVLGNRVRQPTRTVPDAYFGRVAIETLSSITIAAAVESRSGARFLEPLRIRCTFVDDLARYCRPASASVAATRFLLPFGAKIRSTLAMQTPASHQPLCPRQNPRSHVRD